MNRVITVVAMAVVDIFLIIGIIIFVMNDHERWAIAFVFLLFIINSHLQPDKSEKDEQKSGV